MRSRLINCQKVKLSVGQQLIYHLHYSSPINYTPSLLSLARAKRLHLLKREPQKRTQSLTRGLGSNLASLVPCLGTHQAWLGFKKNRLFVN